ncbi:MAG: AEC family transporter [Methanosarcinales archaeon]|jgi:auxin efflux carrier (AEC)|nr:AEC family transporter [Methanosarcinales archaeon]
MDVIFVIIFLILLGWVLKSRGFLAEKDKVTLNNIVIYVGIPALVFNSMLTNVKAEELASFFKLTVFILLISMICAALAFAVGKKLLKLPPKSLAAFILVCACGNTAFMGFPLITGFYGTSGFTRAIFCDVATLIVVVALAGYLGAKVSGQKINVFKQILKFPPSIAWAISLILILFGVRMDMMPSFIPSVLNILAGVVVPLIMISLGISLSGKYLKTALIPAIGVMLIQLVIAPATGVLASPLFSFAELDKKVAVLEASMPPAMTPIIFAEMYGFDTKLISASTFLSTLVSLGSIPILHTLLESGLI